MAKNHQFGNVMLCEHVAEGSRKKHVLVNTYSGDIRVIEFPAEIPFSIYVEVEMRKFGPAAIELTIKAGGKRIGLLKAELDASADAPIGVLAANGIPIRFESAGELVIEAQIDGGRKETILRKKVSADPSLIGS